MAKLKAANENPWYILMTLYGEQAGEQVDNALHDQNRAAWNAWACQAMTSEAQAEVAKRAEVKLAEVRGWKAKKDEISRLHEKAWGNRNGVEKVYPGLPVVADEIDMGEVTFFNAVVFDNAIFSSYAIFHNAHFRRFAFFDTAQFNERSSFGSAQFSGDAFFASAQFSGHAFFDSTKFIKRSSFDKARFSVIAYFDSAQFSGFTYFKHSIFGDGTGEAAKSVRFTGCQFEKPLSFRGAEFRDTYPDFEGAVLHDKAAFTAEKENWPMRLQDDPKQARASCAVIRHALGQQGLPEEEHFFFRREMGFAGQIGGRVQRLPYWLFGRLSNYGYSIWLPLAWLYALWQVPMLVYMCYFNYPGEKERMNGIDGVSVGTFDSASLSFASMFKFLGLQRLHFGADYIQALHVFPELLTAVQSLLGIVLLFFLGLGLRTRFRLR